MFGGVGVGLPRVIPMRKSPVWIKTHPREAHRTSTNPTFRHVSHSMCLIT